MRSGEQPLARRCWPLQRREPRLQVRDGRAKIQDLGLERRDHLATGDRGLVPVVELEQALDGLGAIRRHPLRIEDVALVIGGAGRCLAERSQRLDSGWAGVDDRNRALQRVMVQMNRQNAAILNTPLKELYEPEPDSTASRQRIA